MMSREALITAIPAVIMLAFAAYGVSVISP